MPRGTLETVFKYTPYDELRRLGLGAQTEARMRAAYPKLTGMLVVDEVQPGSAADGVLAPGDILVAIDGKPVPEFFALEDVLDNHVGDAIKVEIQRGNDTLRHALDVESLNSITADEYIEFGEAVVHTLVLSAGAPLQPAHQGVYTSRIPATCSAPPAFPTARSSAPSTARRSKNSPTSRPRSGSWPTARAPPVRYVTLEDPRPPQLKIIRMDRPLVSGAQMQARRRARQCGLA